MIQPSRVALGLMRLKDVTPERLAEVLKDSLAMGITELDIADIYLRGLSETKLGEAFQANPGLRDKFYLQTKVGILKNDAEGLCRYDFSYEHIIEGVNASLARLGTDHVDSLLLHRPDIFADANDIAKAFRELKAQGKVLSFGFSNFPVSMVDYVQSALGEDIHLGTAQYQLGLGHAALFADVFNENNHNPYAPNLDQNLYFYLKKHRIDLEAWSPMQYGFFKGSILKVPEAEGMRRVMAQMAEKYHTTLAGIATAFIVAPWDRIRVVTGSLNPDHIQEIVDGTKVSLSKYDWYTLYKASGNLLP